MGFSSSESSIKRVCAFAWEVVIRLHVMVHRIKARNCWRLKILRVKVVLEGDQFLKKIKKSSICLESECVIALVISLAARDGLCLNTEWTNTLNTEWTNTVNTDLAKSD